ncbi:hypothetical protein AeMF1_002536 [Aphanomyces euteiches]|nr:hypothetical protein AeMF1_002536 [Aphanomyces euteiches]KAH9184047.1 hypothetical protein AeNC1_013974 [Aphanomyces euteiches]
MEAKRDGHGLSKHQWLVNEQAISAIAPKDDDDDDSLETNELEQVYDLFRFYDSSLHGDKLPSINLPRFIEILKDGHILSSTFTAQQAEEVFAAAVLGKLRTYLDSGAALRKLVRRHLFSLMNEVVPVSEQLAPRKSVAGAINDNYWHPLEAQCEVRLQRRRVSQVAYDKVVRHIFPPMEQPAPLDAAITPEIREFFTEEHLALIVDRFHTFDHTDRGRIGKDECFVFFHGLADALRLESPRHLAMQVDGEDISLSQIFRVLMASTEAASPQFQSQTHVAFPDRPTTDDVVEKKDALLALSHDCPPDDWEPDDAMSTTSPVKISTAVDGGSANNTKHITITTKMTKKSKRQNTRDDAVLPRVLMIDSRQSVKKYWEGTMCLTGLAETTGLFQKGEKRVLSENMTKMNSATASISLMKLRVKYKLAEGFVVAEGKKYVADVVAADAPNTKSKQIKKLPPKKLSLDRGSTIVRSMPQLPLYSPNYHQPLYKKPEYQLPTNLKALVVDHKNLSWVHETFPRLHVDDNRRWRTEHIQAEEYMKSMAANELLPQLHQANR